MWQTVVELTVSKLKLFFVAATEVVLKDCSVIIHVTTEQALLNL